MTTREPTYRSRLRESRSDEIFNAIVRTIGAPGRHYLTPGFTAARLARELGVSASYISAAVARHTGMNYNAFVNGYRLRDACRRLRAQRDAALTAEEVGLACGFASRQAFYLAFRKRFGITPQQYRQGAEAAPKAPPPAAR